MGAATALQPQSPLAPTPPTIPKSIDTSSNSVSSSADRIKELESKETETESRVKAIDEATGALTPPKIDLPPPPTPKTTNPLEVWGSAAMTLAALGSLMTRQPLTTALNSAAGVMKAYKQKDIDTANDEFDRWKTSTDFAIKQQNFQMEAYKAALAKASVDQRTALAEFTAYAHAFGDETAVQVANTHELQGAEHLMIDRATLNNKLETSLPKIIQAKEFSEAYQQLQKTPQYQNASPTDRSLMAAQLMPGDALPPKTVDFLAQTYLLKGTLPSLGMKAGGARNQILSRAAEIAFSDNMSAGDVVGMQASVKGQTHALAQIDKTKALIANFEETAKRNADLALSVMNKGTGPLGVPVIDKWIRSGGAATGDPDVTTFNTAIVTFKNEYAKIMSGATGGTGSTDQSRREADDLISPNMTAEQITKNIDFMKKEMNNRIQSLTDMQGALQDSIKGGGPAKTAPSVGDIEDGYKFNGGNPGDPANWSQVQADDEQDDTTTDTGDDEQDDTTTDTGDDDQ